MTERDLITERPWINDRTGKAGEATEVYRGGRPIADCGLTADYAGDCANAAFLTRAVNSHEALVEALRAAVQFMRDSYSDAFDQEHVERVCPAYKQAHTALARAERET
jgi:hypothetical protein